MAYIRKFETNSGKTAVQVCYKERGKVTKTIHIGSAGDRESLNKLLMKAQKIIDADKRALFDIDKFLEEA